MMEKDIEIVEIELRQAVERIRALHHLGDDMVAYFLLHLGIDYYLKSLVQKEITHAGKPNTTPS